MATYLSPYRPELCVCLIVVPEGVWRVKSCTDGGLIVHLQSSYLGSCWWATCEENAHLCKSHKLKIEGSAGRHTETPTHTPASETFC